MLLMLVRVGKVTVLGTGPAISFVNRLVKYLLWTADISLMSLITFPFTFEGPTVALDFIFDLT